MNAREYREHLYQNRAHPEKNGISSAPAEGSSVYLSIGIFLLVEYGLQSKFISYPSGLLFPMGFLVFWAFYYSYYQPGHLEKKLSDEGKWDLRGIPDTLMTSCIWFVKIVFVEFTERIISSIVQPQVKKSKTSTNRKHPRTPTDYSHAFKKSNSQFQSEEKKESIAILPRELSNALHIMGIPMERDWNNIQRRYRELAKKYHPDLNPEITQAGNRFMLYDAAYRKLEAAKSKHFLSKNKAKTN